MRRIKQKIIQFLAVAVVFLVPLLGTVPATASDYQCGKGDGAVRTAINFGCKGTSCNQSNCPAMLDFVFAIIRFLSAGVGLVIVASLVYAGIQYTASRNDPGAVKAARDRIESNVIALLLFIFGFAILNYLIPAGFFKL